MGTFYWTTLLLCEVAVHRVNGIAPGELELSLEVACSRIIGIGRKLHLSLVIHL